MAHDFRPRLAILPPAQRRLWDELRAVPRAFVLYGRTALALQLGHRTAVYFDFFGAAEFAPSRLAESISFRAGATITQQAANTLSAVVERDGPVIVSFFGLPEMRRLAAPLVAPETSLRVASLLDLAGTKAAVVQQRA